jgi:hypothetical protein
MSRRMRLLAIVLVLTFGAAGAVSAFPLTPRFAEAEERSSLLERLLDWLASRVPAGQTSVWENEGSQMDPNGQT